MFGRDLDAEYYREARQNPPGEEVVLEACGLGVQGAYRNVNFALRRGEVLGVAGVIGSGREELTRTLFGFLPQTSGALHIDGHPASLRTPTQAVAAGVGYIPRGRRTEGLVMDISVAANITLARLDAAMRHGFIDHGRERSIAEDWIRRLRIKTPSVMQVCRNLSGGNQQKIVIARWLTAQSRILILDHPTRGLDVGAKEEVYDMIRNLSAEGVAIVLTSDTLEETIGLCHTILVMRDGEITARFDAPPYAPALSAWFDPARLLVVTARREEDLFWAMEEGLRADIAAVVGETPDRDLNMVVIVCGAGDEHLFRPLAGRPDVLVTFVLLQDEARLVTAREAALAPDLARARASCDLFVTTSDVDYVSELVDNLAS